MTAKKRSRTFLPDFKLQPDALKEKFLATVYRGVYRNGFYSLDDSRSHLIWVSCRIWPTVFKPAFPVIFNCSNRNAYRRSAVRYSIGEFINRLRFVLTRQ